MKFQARATAASVAALGAVLAAPAAAETAVSLEVVAEGLQAPLVLVQPEGDDRRFIVEQPGRIRILADDNFLLDEPFLNIEHKIIPLMSTFDERGLLGLTFHPDFEENGRFFVYYSGQIPGDSELGSHLWYSHTNYVAEYRVDPENENRADHGTERILMRFDWPQFNHNGGWLGFGEDGYLYISTGDGGYANDWGIGHHVTMGNGQYLGTHLGKILRIDVDVDEGYYSVPDDNPFADDDTAEPEIWAYGFRNPWRCTFDPDGEIEGVICADVGQNAYEMVRHVQAGENHGWRVMEGSQCFDFENPNDHPESCDNQGMVDPIIEYQNCNVSPDCEGISITGGHVYRGEDEDLAGVYIFGDWSARFDAMDGRLFAGRQNGDGEWEMERMVADGMETLPYILAFGQDADGDVYALTSESLGPTGQLDRIYRIAAGNGAAEPGAMPEPGTEPVTEPVMPQDEEADDEEADEAEAEDDDDAEDDENDDAEDDENDDG
ncbi:PQQ-dependent sugar dehydrogenase [soil metagenome]